MNKSETIRTLAKEGFAVAEIARRVGVRYQFARNVLLAAGMLKAKTSKQAETGSVGRQESKPPLKATILIQAGFAKSSRWLLTHEGRLTLERPLPQAAGVYAIVKDGAALYVGLATMGLAKRFYFYAKPGSTQRTSIRINTLLKAELQSNAGIDVYTATPPDLEWSGLPVSAMAGLEQGLIEAYLLPWNIRGVR